jgi:hypothetical protein
VDPDKAFAVQVAHEEGVLTTSAAYMQCALLYTSSNGERRIRRAPTLSALRGVAPTARTQSGVERPPPVPVLWAPSGAPVR